MSVLRAVRPTTWTIALIAAFATAVAWPTVRELVGRWEPDPENVLGHGWLLLAFIGWAVVVAAQKVDADKANLQSFPFVVLLCLGMAWTAAYNASVFILQAVVWVVSIMVAVWATMGKGGLKRLWWPLSLLFLLVPIWGVFHGVLWALSVKCVGFMVGLLGIPFFMDGNTVRIASGNLEIASGCAGLSFFTVAVSVAFLIGYLNRASWQQHSVLVSAAALVAMVSNWIRITVIVWRAEVTQMQTTLVTEDHYTFGWVVFAVGLLGYCFAFGSYGLRRSDINQLERGSSPQSGGSMPWQRLMLSVLALGVSPLFAAVLASKNQTDPLDRLSANVSDLVPIESGANAWRPALLGPDQQATWEIHRNNRTMMVYEAAYRSQRQGREMIGEGNLLVPDDTWQIMSAAIDADSAVLVALDSGGTAWLVRYGYAVGTWRSARPTAVQLRLGMSSLIGNPVSRFTAVAVPCDRSCDDAQADVLSVWREVAEARVSAVARKSRK